MNRIHTMKTERSGIENRTSLLPPVLVLFILSKLF